MHSLGLSPDASNTEEWADTLRQIRTTPPGERGLMLNPPLCINVEVPSIPARTWPPDATLVPGKVVVPIFLHRNTTAVKVATKTTVNIRPHAVTPAFALTYHKLQGQTVERLIIDANDHPFNPKINFESLLVAVSRVRQGRHLQFIPPPLGQKGLWHLAKLRPSPFTRSTDRLDVEAVSIRRYTPVLSQSVPCGTTRDLRG